MMKRLLCVGLVLLLPSMAQASIQFTFGSGNLSTTSAGDDPTLVANYTSTPGTVGGIGLTVTAPGIGNVNFNATQGLGNSNAGGPLAYFADPEIKEMLQFDFDQTVSLVGGRFFSLRDGESFSVTVDGTTTIDFAGGSGYVSNAYEFLDLSSLPSGTSFKFTAMPYTGASTGGTSFRISQLDVRPIPEPSTIVVWAILGLTGGAAAVWQRRKKNTA